jgi:hypothetical protein
MRPRGLWIVVAAFGSFALTFGVCLFLFWPRAGDCDRDCALAYAAAFTWSIVLGSLIAAVAAFLAYVVLQSTADGGFTPGGGA